MSSALVSSFCPQLHVYKKDAGESPLMLVQLLIEERADLLFNPRNLGGEIGKAQGWLAEQHPARRNTSSGFETDLLLDR